MDELRDEEVYKEILEDMREESEKFGKFWSYCLWMPSFNCFLPSIMLSLLSCCLSRFFDKSCHTSPWSNWRSDFWSRKGTYLFLVLTETS